jgi:hypothetical protein
MKKSYSIEQKQKGADLIGGLMLVILTTLSIKGLILYFKTPENYPFIFSLSAIWLINASTHLLTFRTSRAQNPYKTQFASWEKEGEIYCWFGIKIFRKIIFYSPFVLMSLGLRVWSGRRDFERILRQINMAERSHKLAAIFTGIAVIILFFAGYTTESLYLFAGIILFHAYPVMLQRWNRGRILKLINHTTL